ncbi:hypothetical protein [Bradyrhizobium sp. C9]|uniref:hypothetical protein n=1 Tax=Bradyrhizobium sp. C9 TaxID=142585 RepID=UPI000BEA3916|nr:hypothetical protein [Bradyrhizobium sp. C9]PDT74289.1 hypothetical protein CO675_26305 [Bradyrhizobium sp. C9]
MDGRLGSPSRSDIAFDARFLRLTDMTIDVEAQTALVRFLHSLGPIRARPNRQSSSIMPFTFN